MSSLAGSVTHLRRRLERGRPVTSPYLRSYVRSLGVMSTLATCVIPAGCATDGLGCPRGERGTACRFERAREAEGSRKSQEEGRNDPATGQPLGASGIWGRVERVLLDGQAALAAGRHDDDLMDAMRERCDRDPDARVLERGRAWSCSLDEPIVLFEQRLRLEVGSHGLVSLTAVGVDETRAETFFQTSRLRWATRWCDGPIEILDEDADARYWRCALPERLRLVVGQFREEPADQSSDLWQVSLAIMAAR